jgi:hypothetical protein
MYWYRQPAASGRTPQEAGEKRRAQYGARADQARGHNGIEHGYQKTCSFRTTVLPLVLDRPFFLLSLSTPHIPSVITCYSCVFVPLRFGPVRLCLQLRRKLLGILLRVFPLVDAEVQKVLVESADMFSDSLETPKLLDLCWKVVVMRERSQLRSSACMAVVF